VLGYRRIARGRGLKLYSLRNEAEVHTFLPPPKKRRPRSIRRESERKMLKSAGLRVTTMTAGLMLAALLAVLVLWEARPAEAAFPGGNGKIAFTNYHDCGDVYAVDPAGGEAVNLTNTPCGDNDTMNVNVDQGIDYSPDGEKIAFVRGQDNRGTIRPAEVWVMDANGSNQVQLTNTEGFNMQPAWFPDGRRLAISSNRGDGKADIYILTLNKARDGVVGVRRLTTSHWDDSQPVVSPGGNRIAFVRQTTPSDEIFKLNTNTREGRDNRAVRLTDNNRWFEWNLDWSPNGERLVFEGWRGWYDHDCDCGSWSGADIYSMRSDGNGGWTKLGAGFAPAFSPDGTQIAYSIGNNVWRMKSNGTDRARVTHSLSGIDVWSVSWQPLP
jgi:TolB protein